MNIFTASFQVGLSSLIPTSEDNGRPEQVFELESAAERGKLESAQRYVAPTLLLRPWSSSPPTAKAKRQRRPWELPEEAQDGGEISIHSFFSPFK